MSTKEQVKRRLFGCKATGTAEGVQANCHGRCERIDLYTVICHTRGCACEIRGPLCSQVYLWQEQEQEVGRVLQGATRR